MNQKKDGVILIKDKPHRFEQEFLDEMTVIRHMKETEEEISKYTGKKTEEKGFHIQCSKSSLMRVYEAWKTEQDEEVDFDIFTAAKPSNWIIDVISTSSYLGMDRFRARLNQAVAKMWKSPIHANRRKFAEMFIKPKKIIKKK